MKIMLFNNLLSWHSFLTDSADLALVHTCQLSCSFDCNIATIINQNLVVRGASPQH